MYSLVIIIYRILLPPLCMQASHVDKLKTEPGSLCDKLEEASRSQIHLREIYYTSEEVMEAREDEIKSLQDNVYGTQGEWVAVSDCTCKLNLLFFLFW